MLGEYVWLERPRAAVRGSAPGAALRAASQVATSPLPFQTHSANIPWKKLWAKTDFCVSQSRVKSFQYKIFRFQNKSIIFFQFCSEDANMPVYERPCMMG